MTHYWNTKPCSPSTNDSPKRRRKNYSNENFYFAINSCCWTMPLSCCELKIIAISFPRWPDCVFNIWPFIAMKILPKSILFVSMRVKNFAQIQIYPKYIAKYLQKWWNFAKSGHTVCNNIFSCLWYHCIFWLYKVQIFALSCKGKKFKWKILLFIQKWRQRWSTI